MGDASDPSFDPHMAAASRELPGRDDLDFPLFITLMLHCVVVHAVISLARVTITYRTIELGLSIVWLGAIRDRLLAGADLRRRHARTLHRPRKRRVAAWIGAGFMVLACGGLWLWPNSAIHLFVWSVILGVGQLFSMAAQQVIAVRCAGPRRREWVFGYFMVAIGVGQGLGPTVLSCSGGAALPPTHVLFTFALGGAILAQVVAFALRPAPKAKTKAGPETRGP